MIQEFTDGIVVLTSSLTDIIHSGVSLGMGTFDFNWLFDLFRGA